MVSEAYRDVCFSTCFGNDRSCDCAAWFPGESTPQNPKGHLICDACKHHCSMHKLLPSNGSHVTSRSDDGPRNTPAASSAQCNLSSGSLFPSTSSINGLPRTLGVRPEPDVTNDAGSSYISTLRTLMGSAAANPAFSARRRPPGGKVSRNHSQFFLKATVIVAESNITASVVRAESNTEDYLKFASPLVLRYVIKKYLQASKATRSRYNYVGYRVEHSTMFLYCSSHPGVAFGGAAAAAITWTRLHQAGLIDDLELGGYDPGDWTEQAMLTAIKDKFSALRETGVKFYKSRSSGGLIEAPRPAKGWTFLQIKELLTGSGIKKRLYIGPCQFSIKVEKDGTVSVIRLDVVVGRPGVSGGMSKIQFITSRTAGVPESLGETTEPDRPEIPSTSASGHRVDFTDDELASDSVLSSGRHNQHNSANIPSRSEESTQEPLASCPSTRSPPVLPGWINITQSNSRGSPLSNIRLARLDAELGQPIQGNNSTSSNETTDHIFAPSSAPSDEDMFAENQAGTSGFPAAGGQRNPVHAVINLDSSDTEDDSYVQTVAVPRRSTRLASERYGLADGTSHGSVDIDGMLLEIVGTFVSEFRDPSPVAQPVFVLDVIANAIGGVLQFLRTNTVPLSIRPRVRYQHGQDAGGVLPDIITAAWDQAFAFKFEMIPLFEGDPLKVITAQPVEEWFLISLGKLFHLCAVHNLPWPNYIDDSLFQYMLSEPVDPNRIRGVDHTVSELVDMVASTDGNSNFPAQIEKLTEYLVENNINPSQWNSLPKEAVMSKIVDLELYVRRRGNILLIKEGVNQSNFVKGIKDQSMLANLLAHLHRVVEHPDEMLNQMEAVQGRTVAERVTLKHFQQYVAEAAPGKLQSLLTFITGSSRIPLKKKIVILFQRPGFRPAVATCGPLLKLGTHYRDSLTGYSTFQIELAESISSSQYTFHNA